MDLHRLDQHAPPSRDSFELNLNHSFGDESTSSAKVDGLENRTTPDPPTGEVPSPSETRYSFTAADSEGSIGAGGQGGAAVDGGMAMFGGDPPLPDVMETQMAKAIGKEKVRSRQVSM